MRPKLSRPLQGKGRPLLVKMFPVKSENVKNMRVGHIHELQCQIKYFIVQAWKWTKHLCLFYCVCLRYDHGQSRNVCLMCLQKKGGVGAHSLLTRAPIISVV